ncbi:MAG TPA: DedA family protein [Gemmataceae bacterium]|nr:DedA family protein [Gemmataceae bacterium]
METLNWAVDAFLHLDAHLSLLAAKFGIWLYAILWLIIFCETGLVVTPILPGDSLLFAVGALASSDDSDLNIALLVISLSFAAVLGDAVNYAIGHYLGPKVFRYEKSRFFNPEHLLRTQRFYDKYGSKMIVLARFVPIVRTFAPFVAGIGEMRYPKFFIYNLFGGIAWVTAFLLAGYWLGSSPLVKTRFHIIIVAILVISVLPMVFEYFIARRHRKAELLAQASEANPVSQDAEPSPRG